MPVGVCERTLRPDGNFRSSPGSGRRTRSDQELPMISLAALVLTCTVLPPCPAALPAALPSAPDVLLPGTHGVRFEAVVQLGAIAPIALTSHTVAEGETLSAIAKARLGEIARWREIVALNPGLEPSRLEIGQRIWLPPVAPVAERSERVHVFLWTDPMFGRAPQPFDASQPLPFFKWQCRVLLVDAGQLVALQVALEAKDPQAAITQADWAWLSRPISPVRAVDDSDPTRSIRQTFELREVVEGEVTRLELQDVSTERFDAEGQPIRKSAEGGPERRDGTLLLVLLALAGGAGLALLSWRRRAVLAAGALADVPTA
ncbi:MAG: LysM peptidoglycan-binding domain-containing protein [Planctomycetes bacterium]|nr:LysM peptidoglycan-binding domain-containing protein [Planctomycetota bacterium]